jgi:hypothetical protein
MKLARPQLIGSPLPGVIVLVVLIVRAWLLFFPK